MLYLRNSAINNFILHVRISIIFVATSSQGSAVMVSESVVCSESVAESDFLSMNLVSTVYFCLAQY